MKDINDVLAEMLKAKAKWLDAEEVDDAEDMWTEYPEFLKWAVPVLEQHLKEFERLEKEHNDRSWEQCDGSYR